VHLIFFGVRHKSAGRNIYFLFTFFFCLVTKETKKQGCMPIWTVLSLGFARNPSRSHESVILGACPDLIFKLIV
jgi:hypothetical protein